MGPDVLREYLDWRPYEYFTNRFTPLGGGMPLFVPGVETTEFIPTDAGTTVHYRFPDGPKSPGDETDRAVCIACEGRTTLVPER